MKNKYRKRHREISKSLADKYQHVSDEVIFSKLISHPKLVSSEHIMIYMSMPVEVDTSRLIKHLISQKKNIYIPVIINDQIEISSISDTSALIPNKFGIPEPLKKEINIVSPQILEVVILPGICFTQDGIRLGHGGGYFDRFLKKLHADIWSIGLCYGTHLEDDIPHNESDVKVNEVITENSFNIGLIQNKGGNPC